MTMTRKQFNVFEDKMIRYGAERIHTAGGYVIYHDGHSFYTPEDYERYLHKNNQRHNYPHRILRDPAVDDMAFLYDGQYSTPPKPRSLWNDIMDQFKPKPKPKKAPLAKEFRRR